eukprot:1159299-Pelagomonas_calceolata.AAC.2
MVPSYEMHVLGVLNLQRQQEADGFLPRVFAKKKKTPGKEKLCTRIQAHTVCVPSQGRNAILKGLMQMGLKSQMQICLTSDRDGFNSFDANGSDSQSVQLRFHLLHLETINVAEDLDGRCSQVAPCAAQRHERCTNSQQAHHAQRNDMKDAPTANKRTMCSITAWRA